MMSDGILGESSMYFSNSLLTVLIIAVSLAVSDSSDSSRGSISAIKQPSSYTGDTILALLIPSITIRVVFSGCLST